LLQSACVAARKLLLQARSSQLRPNPTGKKSSVRKRVRDAWWGLLCYMHSEQDFRGVELSQYHL